MARLGDYVRIRTGKLDANASSENGQYPFFTCAVEPLKIDTYSYDCECVLVAGNGDLNVKYYNGKFDAYQRTYIIESLDKTVLSVPYLYCFLDKYVETLRQQAIGGVIKYIKLGNLTEAEIPIPSITEQQKIVANLAKVNELIALRKEQLARLDKLVKARFIELFGDPVASNNKRKLSEIGRVFTGNTPSMKESSYYESNDIPFIKPSDLNESGVTNIDGVEAYVSKKARPVARIIPPNAVLVTCIGTIGKIGITTRESCCNQQINFIVPDDGIDSLYLAHCLTFFKSTLQSIANAPVVPIINKTQFSELEVPVFDSAKQNQFAAFVEQTDKSKLAIQASLDKLELLKKSLMQEYFG